ncbi:MAG: hypothetical protein V1702_00735 [Candidatus Woesearchaeota archaeon]
MDTRSKVITDIELAIRECLSVLRAHFPQIYLELIARRYNKGGVETPVSHIIYRLYNADPKIAQYFKDILGNEVKEQYSERVKALNKFFIEALERARYIVEQYRSVLDINYGSGWIQVNPKGRLETTRKMYLNCEPAYIDKVIGELVKLMIHGFVNTRPAIIFKFPNPSNADMRVLIRSEKIVVYYGNDQLTHGVLADWAGMMSKYFRENAPLFTKKAREGVAFAYEPSPDQQEYAREHTGEEASFGYFMSLVIARHLYTWCILHQRIPGAIEIRQIAIEIFEDKLMAKHKYKF